MLPELATESLTGLVFAVWRGMLYSTVQERLELEIRRTGGQSLDTTGNDKKFFYRL